MYRSTFVLILTLITSLAVAVDAGDKPTPVDDPIGLGERLALIDYLRDEKQQTLPSNPSLQDLRRMYWKLENAQDVSEALAERDRIMRLKHMIEVTYAIVTPENCSYQELQEIKEQQEKKARIELEKLTAQPEAAPNAAPSNSDSTTSHQSGNSSDLNHIKKSVVLIATAQATGSGFFISGSGHLITNRHVVGDDSLGKYVTIYWDAAQKRDPENFSIIAVSQEQDLALLKPMKPGNSYTYFKISKQYEITKDILVAGFPLGASIGRSLGTNDIDLTMTKGSISSIRRKDDTILYLQTDASASQGNSGGPLLDMQTHQVLGIITKAIDPKDSGASGQIMTFAIPSDAIQKEFKKHLGR